MTLSVARLYKYFSYINALIPKITIIDFNNININNINPSITHNEFYIISISIINHEITHNKKLKSYESNKKKFK